MNRRKRSQIALGGAIVLVAATAVTSTPAAADAGTAGGTATTLDAAATAALQAYDDQLAVVYGATKARGALTLSKLTSAAAASTSALASRTAQPIATAVRGGGDVVTGATVTSEVTGSTKSSSGTITVSVDMTTTLTIADDGSGNPDTSSWSDPHQITLAPSGESYGATSNVIIDAPPNTEDPGDDPTPGTPDLPGEPSIPGPVKTVPPQPTPLAAPKSLAGAGTTTTDTATAQSVSDSAASSTSAGASSAIKPSATKTLSTATAAATSGYPTETKISPTAFSKYALKWTSSPYNGNEKSDFNSTYPFYGNNCANFASQVLDAGGWFRTGGNSLQQNDNTKWTYNLAGYKGATRTWYSAKYLNIFAYNTGTYGWLDNIWNARTGDLLFVDWDPNGKADGSIDHVMVVSGVTSGGEPRISQKSNNRNNITLTTSIALAKQQGKTSITWYGLKHK